MANNNHEKVVIDKIKGTISDLKKGETLAPIYERMSGNRNKFENLKNKINFQKQNEKLINELKNTYEEWEKNLSEADKKSDKKKQILFFLKKITEPNNKEVSEEENSSSTKERTKNNQSPDAHNNTKNPPKYKVEKQTSPKSHSMSNNNTPMKNTADVQSLKRELKVEINNLEHKFLKPISAMEEQGKTTLAGLGTIEKKFKSLAGDIVYEISKANKDQSILATIEESVDFLPVKIVEIEKSLEKIEKKIDSTGSQALSAISSDIPEDEKAILELSRYMKDGLDQLENIARYHISKQREIEKIEKKSVDLDVQIEEQKTNAFEKGKREAKIELVKSIYRNHPTAFKEVKSVFGDIVSEKYDIGQTISVTDENKKKLAVTIDGIQEVGDYTIEAIALLVNDEPLISATVKKI